jgi:site-specific DNA-adenine methylase
MKGFKSIILFLNMAAKEIGEYFIKDIRKDLEKVYPKLKEYLQNNRPELLYLYEDYYQKAMYHHDPFIASEYAARIFRAYLSIKGFK